MKLTPEQWAEVERQRRENPGAPRIMLEFTPEQAEEYRRMVEVEEAGRETNIAFARKLLAAAREPGFAGDLRRAMNATRKLPDQLAMEFGIDVDLLEDFRTGDATLPSDVVERLVAVLGLKLVPVVQS